MAAAVAFLQFHSGDDATHGTKRSGQRSVCSLHIKECVSGGRKSGRSVQVVVVVVVALKLNHRNSAGGYYNGALKLLCHRYLPFSDLHSVVSSGLKKLAAARSL